MIFKGNDDFLIEDYELNFQTLQGFSTGRLCFYNNSKFIT